MNCSVITEQQLAIPLPLLQPVYVSLGAYGRLSHTEAISQALYVPPVEPLLGQLSTTKLQLCPQNRGQLDLRLATALRRNHPEVEWRLHANVQVEASLRRVDLCDWPQEVAWFGKVAQVSAALNAPVYTAHAGRRDKASIKDVLRYTQEAEQFLGIPVGIEGHYPLPASSSLPTNTWLFSSWREYQQLLESGVHYALDLSHLHILAAVSGKVEWNLVCELLASPQCLEVHLSSNDGSADQHAPLDEELLPWWWPLLPAIQAEAVIFSEGRQVYSS